MPSDISTLLQKPLSTNLRSIKPPSSMAIITEEPDSSSTPITRPIKRKKLATPTPSPTSPESEPRPKPSTTSPQTQNNPFAFWFYFTISASLLTLIFITISSLSSINQQDPKLWFLSLPTLLRHHFSSGRSIKVQPIPDSPSSTLEVFTVQHGPPTQIPVLIVHGLGCSSFSFSKTVKSLAHEGLYAVAIDLPGSGFSDKSVTLVEERETSNLGVVGPRSVWEIYSEIKEKGLFWGFDQLVENGYVDYEEKKEKVSRVEVVKPIELGGEEMGKVLGQVIDSLGLGQVDLVLHDSAFGLGANWVSENVGLVRSVTILDGVWSETGTALPLWLLRVPVVREVVLGFGFVFRRAVEWCCTRPGGEVDADAHRVLLKGRDGRRAVVGMGRQLNCSFNLAEWGKLDDVKSLPIQVIWSSCSSNEWSEEGNRVASALPRAKFVTHSGGRWPQEDTADELADIIYRFVSSLPKATRPVKEDEPVPDHIQQMLDEEKAGSHQHHHQHGDGGHGHHHDHGHDAGFVDAYGLGQGWGS